MEDNLITGYAYMYKSHFECLKNAHAHTDQPEEHRSQMIVRKTRLIFIFHKYRTIL